MSGAESVLDQGTEQGAEEVLSQGANSQGTQGTGEGDAGGEGQWKDLNPEEFDPVLRDQVVKLNKSAVSQFQNKVRKLAEDGKLTKGKLQELEQKYAGAQQLFGRWANDPDQFLQWHRQNNPDYWKNKDNADKSQLTDQDKQAVGVLVNALKKEGKIVTQEDIKPLLQYVQQFAKTNAAEREAKAQSEIDETSKWCAENKYPWSDDICTACIALIGNGRAKDLKSAYEIIAKPVIDQANQANLTRKKGGITTQPQGPKNAKRTNLSLDQIIDEIDG